MSKISNQSAYPAATPVDGDYLIGTDISDSNATKTFTVGSIVALTPADTLAEVLAAGNTATNNIVLTGNITCTTIIPTDIQDAAGNTGTVGQHLVKNAANALEWGAGSADTLANVLTAGNTATNDINLTGNITLTNGGTPGVGSIVMSGSITAATGTVSATGFQASSYFQGALLNATNIQDVAGNTGTAGQYLRKSAANALAWETVTSTTPPLADVLTAGNTATNDINLTGNIALTGNLTGSGNITRTGTVTITGGIGTTLSITSGADIEAVGFVGAGSYLKGNGTNALKLPNLQAFRDDAAAAALTAGDVYQTDGTGVAPLNVAGILMIKQ